jgi:glycine cleavage system aminomethyltransferase T
MGYVDIEFAKEGTNIFIEIRNRQAEAVIENPPFLDK